MQTIHTRFFGWTTWVASDVIDGILAARFIMLAFMAAAAAGVVLLARKLVDDRTALLCGLIYLTAGFNFTNGFTYRPDPVVAGLLMGSLCLLALGRLSWGRVLIAGALVGIAGTLTIKSIFYAPCFAAVAFIRLREEPAAIKLRLVQFGVVVVSALACYAALMAWHSTGIVAGEGPPSNLGRSMSNFLRFFEFEKFRYVIAEMALAPVVTLGLFLLPVFGRKLPRNSQILLLGLVGPLLCLLFYRNTFPYFFTFLLAPICVAIAPVVVKMVQRYGVAPVIGLALLGPVFLLSQEPYGTLDRQRATIAEVKRLFPEPTPYLSYSNYVPDYPRQFPSLISGVALDRYVTQRPGDMARDIQAGRIAFVIATGDALDLVYDGDGSLSLLPKEDEAALRQNFLHHVGRIYIAGRKICPRAGVQSVPLYRTGAYTVDGADILINGTRLSDGQTIRLKPGRHDVRHEDGACVKLWALNQVPEAPANYPDGPIAGGY